MCSNVCTSVDVYTDINAVDTTADAVDSATVDYKV